MKHKNVLKRSWELLWSYRAMWIFGILLALTTAGYSAQSSWSGSNSEYENDVRSYQLQPGETFGDLLDRAFDDVERDLSRDLERDFGWEFGEVRQTVYNTITTFIIVIVALFIIGRVLHYISQTAIIRMVNDVEETEKKYSMREGFGLGWSSTSWKMFLVDLVFFVPLFALSVGFLLLVFWPMFSNIIFVGETPQNILSMVTSIGLFFLFVMVMVVGTAVLRFVKKFMRRTLVLEDVGVFGAIKQGNAFAWKNFKDVGLMWLINFGITIGWGIVMFPVVLVMLVLAGAVASAIALVTYGVSGGSVITVFIVGILTLILVMTPPLAFLNGLKFTYVSSTWTLTYRELSQLDTGVLDTAALEEGAAAS